MNRFLLGCLLLAALIGLPQPATAIPVFAHRYGLSCQSCHTIVPRLNATGEAFKAAGYRWPGDVSTRPAIPVTVKTNLAYSSAQDPTGLPKAIVDEIEFLAMGAAGKQLAYRFEQYSLDGGRPGKTRDAYLEFNTDPMRAWTGSPHSTLDIQAGEFTLPLPDDPETMRPTENHYAIFDQTVGLNSFSLFDDRIGVNAALVMRNVQINLLALKGNDRMAAARFGSNALAFSAYQYDGTSPIAGTSDLFWRRGYALTSIDGKSRASLLLQTGNDSSPDGTGVPEFSSGGYLQEEWAFSDRFIGVVRYDGVNSPNAFLRSATFSINFRPYDRARLTIEDVFTTQPKTSHAFAAAWLFAY